MKSSAMAGYTPRPLGEKRCPSRQSSELVQAAKALGHTLVFGTEISYELQSLAKNPMHPYHATAQPESQQLFILLQAMLISERWLIEFLLGPPKSKRPDDICVDCFQHDWRFPQGPMADQLKRRAERANKLVMHPTWQLIDFSPRAWTLDRVETCIDALDTFRAGVEASQPAVAAVLREHVAAGKHASLNGRSDGLHWLTLVEPSVSGIQQPM